MKLNESRRVFVLAKEQPDRHLAVDHAVFRVGVVIDSRHASVKPSLKDRALSKLAIFTCTNHRRGYIPDSQTPNVDANSRLSFVVFLLPKKCPKVLSLTVYLPHQLESCSRKSGRQLNRKWFAVPRSDWRNQIAKRAIGCLVALLALQKIENTHKTILASQGA